MKFLCFLVLFLFGCANTIHAQTMTIPLTEIAPLDSALNFDAPRSHPMVSVKLPNVDTTGARFHAFYSFWKENKGPWVVIMVVPKKDGEQLFIDHNYNNDLTDDGKPHFFPYKKNTFMFDMVNKTDKRQFIRTAYYRKPPKKGLLKALVDEQGNMTPKGVERARLLFQLPDSFTGKCGSFYWTDRIDTHRGTVMIDGTKHLLGLHDFTYDGIYDDVETRMGDRLFIDVKDRGVLNMLDPENYFSLIDTFTVGTKNYRVKRADRYGTWVELEFIPGDTSRHTRFTHMKVSIVKPAIAPIDTSWMGIADTTLSGENIRLSDYRGKYVLLNFWGEWCSGCRQEISALKKAVKKIPNSKLQVVSFVYSENLNNSKRMIRDSSITWPQIALSKQMEERFKIDSYPTNILISPNGKEVLRTHVVNDKFFESNVQ